VRIALCKNLVQTLQKYHYHNVTATIWKADLKMQMNNKQFLSMFNNKVNFDLSYSFCFNVVANKFLSLSVLNCYIDSNNDFFKIWIYGLMTILNKKK